MDKIWMKNWPEGIPVELNYLHGEKPICEHLRLHAAQTPQRVAVNFYGKEITYAELDQLTNRFASYLESQGAKKGDRIALYMQNCPQYVICQLGAHKAGLIVVPCGPMFKAWELEEELTQTGTKIIVCQDELFPNVDEANAKCGFDLIIATGFADYLPGEPAFPLHESMTAPRVECSGAVELLAALDQGRPEYASPEIGLEDVCLLQFTSGTTGLPKGAMLTHGNQLYKSACQAQMYKYQPEDVMITAMPIYHIAGMLWGLTTPVYSGCTMVIMSRFDPAAMAAAITNLKVTKLYGTVSMNTDMLALPDLDSFDLSSLRINPATSFGIFLTEEVATSWGEVTGGGVIVEAAYGLSETHTGDTFSPLDKPRHGSVGIPHTGTDLRIMDFDDPQRELGPGEVGEITVKSPAVFKGYWDRAEATAEVLRDGRLYTGDMGRFDEDGYVYFLGRKKEMIKASGYAIAPEEVEGFLMRHPAVDQAACIPIPDPKRGESVKAFVVLAPEHQGKISERELIDWAKDKMAAYKYPRVIEFMAELPKGTTGKLLRRVLREAEGAKQ
ncbi:MAG: AMP-binding protein [Desulfarculaceae bacterium]|nr:AMP-binding protein [Desulfarculaceae bacterium]MCF8071175.1 AMP-binding protein [Desulfarculaceae bacterium]MCF8101222.1 AMP-binding protein [Desulfarculaceae bacterium]MCF8115229.1 AMP-binding protein [Desulfarculaceae bacterium]